MPEKQPLILLIGSRTGGPLIPLLGMKDEIIKEVRARKAPEPRFMIIGIRGGFEEQAARSENLPLVYLPEVKGKPSPGDLGGGGMRLLGMALLPALWVIFLGRLSWSTLRAWLYLRKHRPALILSMSNFLSVPVVWAAAFENAWRRLAGPFRRLFRVAPRPAIRTALHQLDIQNLTVKLTAPFIHLLTVGFESIRRGSSLVVPNPVRYEKFDALTEQAARDSLRREDLIGSSKEPVLLVFGGGSGALFINRWLHENFQELTRHFRVLHLTGFLQDKSFEFPQHPNYRGCTGLTDLMPAALIGSDLILARAGMSTISELLYLRKNAYLVPIPGGHQVHNARAVSDYFQTLEQKHVGQWVEQLAADKGDGFSRFHSVRWEYFTDANRHAYRDLLLELLD